MKTLNNFDTSSTGVNIEFIGGYNTIDSLDNFKPEGDKLIYTEWGNLPSDWKPTEHLDQDIPIGEFIKVCLKEDWYNFFGRIESVKAKLVVLHEWFGVDSWREIDREQITEWALEFFDSSVTDGLKENYLTKNYTEKRVYGYCQGDVIDVIVPNDLREILGTHSEHEIVSSKQLKNLAFDSPVHARLTIDGEEYYLDEMLDDRYTWDKEQAIHQLGITLSTEQLANKERVEYILEWCEENIPNDLEYV